MEFLLDVRLNVSLHLLWHRRLHRETVAEVLEDGLVHGDDVLGQPALPFADDFRVNRAETFVPVPAALRRHLLHQLPVFSDFNAFMLAFQMPL